MSGRARPGRSPELVVDDRCRALRRSLGPTAWVVLEEVLLDARVLDGRLVAATNVRRIAGQLGLSKDTAARALVRLTAAGLVVREDRRDERTGTFASGRYVLAADIGRLLVAGADQRVEPPPRPSGRRPSFDPQPPLFVDSSSQVDR